MQKAILFLVLLIGKSFIAQENDLGLGIKYKHGFLIAHRPIMNHLPESNTNSIEAFAFVQTKGKKNWHKAFNYPQVGAALLYTSAGNNEVLGKYFGFYPFLQFNLLKTTKNKLNFKIGSGLGYGTKVYDILTNPKNVAISSHFNALINFTLAYQYKVKKNEFSFGMEMTHFSNGSSKLPNLGLNLPSLSISYARKMTESDIVKEKAAEIDHAWKYSVIAIASSKDSYPSGQEKFLVTALSLNAQKAFSHAVGYEAGLDFIYSPSIQKYKPVIPKSPESMMQIGLYNSYFLTLEHLQIHVGMGVYLRDEYLANDYFYHRFGFKYSFNNGLLLNLTLKSNWAKADYLEYGIGYRF